MLRSAKTAAGLFARKACAFLIAYCFFATSLWSATGSGAEQSGRRPAEWTTLTGAGLGDIERALAREHSILPGRNINGAVEAAGLGKGNISSNFAALKAPMMPLAMQSGGSGGATATVGIFGPQQYVRTTGAPNTYTTTVQVPAWVSSPFNLHIQSGEANGSNRVSSATITVNNVQVAGTSDFNQTVFTLDRSVTLTPTTTMVVTLASKPGSYLRINLGGQSHDHTPPLLTIAAPVTNSAINTPQAHLDLHYQDLPGAGETAASGVNTTTLQVLLDGVDRTSLFVKRSDEATADLPASLALSPGPHTLSASIKDNAGNTAQATSQFQLDVTPPTLQILQPATGVYLNTTTPQIQLAFSDNFAIDPSTLRVSINGVDRTSVFAVTATGATGVPSTPLATGANSIVATIADKAGNQAHASASFNVDTTPPVITILHPAQGTLHDSSTVEFSIQFTDDQAIDASTLRVNVDGTPLGLTINQNLASGASTLSDGSHTVTATIKDKAGNQGSASSTFTVNTTAPDIHITKPLPGAILNTSNTQVQVDYGDNSNLNVSSLQVSVDGINVTPSLSVTGTSASGLLQGPLAEGNHTITAQIANQAGTIGHASASFFVDTVRPQLTIVSPAGAVNSTFPSAVAQYSDSGSGINVNSVHAFLDGVDVTSSFSVGASSIQGAFTTGLSEGTHQLRVTVVDRAGNIADQTASFLVDVTAPTASFTSPANNAFTNNVTPAVVLAYSDGLSGVDGNFIHIFLQPLNGTETEITSAFTLGASQASGNITTPLTPGTYHLRATVADKAGNITNTDSAFAVDTTPPTYNIQFPAANAFLKTATPNFVVSYQDDSSGVDPHQFALRIDGTDHTAAMSATETGASGTLPSSEALSEGPHQVEVTVIDRAGNQAAVVPQPFFVDTIAPLISITAPAAAAFTNNNHLSISVAYSDSGSGIDATSFRILIDGVDHTAEFTAIDNGASGAPVAALTEGTHSISVSISDFAGNTSTAASSFVVDTIPPQITITQPVDGIFTNAVSVIVSGSIVDASPVVVTVEGATVPLQGNTFTSAAITLGANGPQVLHVTATDAAGNSSAAAITLKIDRTPPVISGSVTPVPNAAGWNNTPVTVTFTCSDADSGIATCPAPVPVDIEGADQSILGTAVDKAGNTAQATVKVSIDKTAPVITATPAPAPNAAGWNITDVTISYACSDSLSGVVACPAPQVVSAEGKAEPITATISDKAGNTATSTVILNIEKTAPTIAALLSPSPNAAGWNKTDVTVSFNCTPSISDIVTCQSPVTVTNEGKAQSVPGSVSDQAGKTASTTAIVNIDKTAPLISASAAPPANGAGWNNTDVVISYVCSDSLSGIAVCPPPAHVSAEGANEIITGQATDQAGNTAIATSTLNIDKTPPTITATSAPPANGAGWNNTNVTVSFSCADNLSGVASCPSTTQVSSEGQNQPVPGQAVDVAGNVATGSITVSIDKTAPSIVQISAPDHISRLHGGQIDVTVNDNFTVTQVVISLNGTTLTTSASAPYQAPLQVPAGSNPGDTLTISVQATDEAGNVQTASRGVRVAADGVVVGQVLSDTTSFPVQGASVQAIAKTPLADQTDTRGRYSLQVSDSHLFVNVSSPGTTSVEREVFVQEGVGTVPVDARLTPLSAPVPVGSAGGTIKSGNIVLSVPAGIVMDGTSLQLTSLSGQGLPGLLPLGWSPLAAFDVRASASAANISAGITQLPNVVSHLVTYDPALHAWTMVTPNIQVVNGGASVTLPTPGAYALVVPDTVDPPVTIPNPGNAIVGIDMQVLSPSSTSSGSLSPAILPPSGGTATATLGIQGPTFVPSGTVIQANVSEKFSLKSGDVVSEENRSEDIVLYNAIAPTGSSLGAQFPVVPSHKFANAELLTGKVHLDILAGREGVRGQPGGSNPLVLNDGVTTLSVPGGALSEDTAISIQSITFEDFIPVTTSFGPLQEVIVDFSGEMLNTPAQLSVSATGLNPAHSFLLTKVERIDGIPRIVAVALAQINGANLTSVASPGLPGVTEGGEYVFYELSAPSGFIQGIISTSVGPLQALVQTDSLPLVSITGVDGRFILPTLTGSVNVTASVPHTNLLGTASVQVNAGQTTPLNITLSGTVTNAVVSPADGTLGVPVSTVITVTTTSPLNPQSIQQGNLVLLKGTASSGTPVALQPFVLSTSGTVLSFAPQKNLDPAAQYTIQVSGLADNFGGAIVVPSASFTTKAVAPINFDPNALTFSFPDANGNIHVSAPAGSLPPGTKILIIDQTSGLVLSLTALNDGSVSGDFPGTINDVLQITVTDPNGATATFTRSQFVAADGTVAIGAGGGTVAGPGNTGLIIPAGALLRGATFKLTPLDQTAFPQLPTWAGLSFGSGLHVDAPDMPSFNQEVKLAFPVPPNAPANAFYYVYRRLKDQDGKTYFETIDHAFVQGTGANAQVVTASPPFCGYHNPIGNFNIAVAASSGSFPGGSIFTPASTPFQDFILMFDIAQPDPNQPGIASPGLIVGLVQQTVPAVLGQSAQTTRPYIDNVLISLDSDPSQVANYDPKCSTFTIFDPRLGGGSRNITATARATLPDGSTQNTTVIHAVVNEVNGVQVDDATFGIFAGLENQYRNIGRVTITFPPSTPPSPPPQLSIRTFTLDANGHRVPASGILQTGTNIIIALQSKLTVQSVSVSGTQLAVTSPDSAPEVNDGKPEKLLLDARASNTFAPGAAGTYTITATALDPISLTRVTSNQSFLVVAPGGGNNSTIVCSAATPPAAPTSGCTLPRVIDSVPLNGATSVAPEVFPQIAFNEPVTHVPGNIVLADHTGTAVPVQLIGIKAFDPNNPNASLVANPLRSTDIITSVTIQPLFGLKYNETYTLTLNANSSNGCVDSNNNPAPVPANSSLIIDLNQPPTGPLCLEPFPKPGDPPYKFTTFGPQELGGTTDRFSSTRPVVIGQRAFLGERLNASIGGLASVDISDPEHPVDKGFAPGAAFTGLPIDIAGQASSPVTGGPLVAVAAAQPPIELILPSNVWIYDVTNPDAPVRVAAVSATTSNTQDGQLLRVFMKDQFLYTSTFLKGLQVIDLNAAVAEYQSVFSTDPVQFGQAITTEGNGFATDTVTNTIPLFAKNYQNVPPSPDYVATMYDVKAADYVTSPPPAGSPDGTPGITQTLVVSTGRLPLVIADPQQAGATAVLYPHSVGTASNGLPSLDPAPLSFQAQNPDGTAATYTLQTGRALALSTLSVTDSQGNSNSEQVAVIVGTGAGPALPDGTSAQSVLVVVNFVANAGINPVMQGLVSLPAFATDAVVHGNLALVGTNANKILLVSLVDPAHPVLAGEIDPPAGSVFGDRIAVTDDGLIATSSFNTSFGGLTTATLAYRINVASVTPFMETDSNGQTTAAGQVTYTTNFPAGDLSNGVVELLEDNNVVASFPATDLSPGTHTIPIPAGTKFNIAPESLQIALQQPDGSWSDNTTVSIMNPAASSTIPTVDLDTQASLTSAIVDVNPNFAFKGATGVSVTLTGVNLAGLASVNLLDATGAVTSIPVTTGSTLPTFQIPDAALQQTGVLQISLPKSSIQIPFMVADPGLNSLPANDDFAVISAAVEPALPAGATVTVEGSNFENGMSVVIGRGSTYGFALPTTFIDDHTLQAQITQSVTGANDLSFAVLSADGSLISSPFTVEAPEITDLGTDPATGDELQPDSAASLPANAVAITNVTGDINWQPTSASHFVPETLTIEGVGLKEGMLVQFTQIRDGNKIVATAPLTGVTNVLDDGTNAYLFDSHLPPFARALRSPYQGAGTGGSVAPRRQRQTGQVPRPNTTGRQKKRSTRVRAQSKTANKTVISPTLPFNANTALEVPFGGRLPVKIYEGQDGKLYVIGAYELPPPNLKAQLMRNDPTVTVTLDATAKTFMQVEHEDKDTQNWYIRGLQLTYDVNEKRTSPAVTISVSHTVDSKTTETGARTIDIKFRKLGSGDITLDKQIAEAANTYGVPPQFLKAQGVQESGLLRENFRYEPSTIDFASYSGDAGRGLSNSPHILYAITGTLVPKTNKTKVCFTGGTNSYNFGKGQLACAPAGAGPYKVNSLIKRAVGGVVPRYDPQQTVYETGCARPGSCAVQATIDRYDVTKTPFKLLSSTPLNLIKSTLVWRRCIKNSSKPQCSFPVPPQGIPDQVAIVSPVDGQFAVDFADPAGTIKLSRPLLDDGKTVERLTVSYYPLPAQGSSTPTGNNAGYFTINAPAGLLANVRSGEPKLHYTPPFPDAHLCDWFADQLKRDPFGVFLSFTLSDGSLEFFMNSQLQPTGVRDPRYCEATPQFYAAASYGVLQNDLRSWSKGSLRERAFTSILDVGDTSNGVKTAIYSLLDDLKTGLNLGAAFHQTTVITRYGTPYCDQCTALTFASRWSQILDAYNHGGAGYAIGKNGLNGIITKGQNYEPAAYVPQATK